MADIDIFRQWADDNWPGLNEALGQVPTVSVRRNPAKPGRLDLHSDGTVSWCADGFYLADRPAFTLDPCLHQGRYYVQDASSMVVGYIAAMLADRIELPATRPLLYLDACAAPGGKSTAAIAALPPTAVVFANEFDYRRANILLENITKWGSPRTVVTRGDTNLYSRLCSFFDIIAVDAPCSGEGMMRKDPAAVAQWSPRLVQECAVRQREILDKLWPALRPGGFLIYSTCTFNTQENEQLTACFAADTGATFIELPLANFDGVEVNDCHYRFMPGLVRGEGLCVCVVQKPFDADTKPAGVGKRSSKHDTGRKGTTAVSIPDAFRQLLPADCRIVVGEDGNVSVMEADMAALVDPVLPALDVLSAGVGAGQFKGRDFIPSQALAMSWWLRNHDPIESYAVDKIQALAFLRREAIQLSDEVRKGFVLLTYDGWPLGWVKNLGRRCNNLYPAPWRILHG